VLNVRRAALLANKRLALVCLMSQPGESTELRACDFCHHTLAEWRGIVEGDKFFCNQEHQADFHAGKHYQRAQN
ncbi:hypothetical protein J8J17_25325, partial [Mycobacterium tuberculosis]|nr:hypothetical protein [Mycobacterium tuberculosis]